MNNWAEETGAAVQQGVLGRPPSLRESTEQELRMHEAGIKRCQELLALLDRNPEVNRIMELLGRKY